MSEINKIADFLYLHIIDCLRDGNFKRSLMRYRSSASTQTSFNKAFKEYLTAVEDKTSIDKIWHAAAISALWIARIADQYEKEMDKLNRQS